MTAPARDECPECLAIAAAILPGQREVCACGAEIRRAGLAIARLADGPPRRPRPSSGPAWARVVRDLLSWDLVEAVREQHAIAPARCPWASVLRFGEVGILGDGCSGTKGTGRAPTPDPEPVRLPAHSHEAERYRALSKSTRATADAVMADGQGDVVLGVLLAWRVVELSLEQRIGLALASQAQREKWLAKVAAGDSRLSLDGMCVAGQKALKRLTEEWNV